MRKISILGSTGSIGTQTLEVVQNLPEIQVAALTAHQNIELLAQQVAAFKPAMVAITDEAAAQAFQKQYGRPGLKVCSGTDGLLEVAAMNETDLVVNALVGSAGLVPTVTAIKAKKDVALANKETLVCAGEAVMALAKETGVSIIPIDSEHSGVFQCLQGNAENAVDTIYLTASGGPFRGKTREELAHVTVEQALAHPKWDMGAKISIDSATLMNKGLEVIEACRLFNVSSKQVAVLVHPQSVIHAMVAFQDGTVMAQLGEADMRIPIQYALTHPLRPQNNFKRLDFMTCGPLTFQPPDMDTFPALQLAYQALEAGGLLPAVLNGANEMAVDLFLKQQIPFLRIPALIENALKAYTVQHDAQKMPCTVEGAVQADAWGKTYVYEAIF